MTNIHFGTFALENIRIDENGNGLIVLVPSQTGHWNTVQCSEEGRVPTPISCSCHRMNCSHMEMVQAYWNRIYKVAAPVVEAPVIEVRKPRNGLVRKVRGGGLVRVEQPAAPVAVKVTPVAKIIEFPVQAPKITDISTRGNFGTKGFSLMR